MHEESRGWDDVAERFIEARSTVGIEIIAGWAQHLPKGCDILDIGCGHGDPVSLLLQSLGFRIYGIEASPKLTAAFRKRLPEAKIICEAAERSGFYSRAFDGVIAVGLMFLLEPDVQRELIQRVGQATKLGGSFMFTAPWQICEWEDLLTGRISRSLGREAYENSARAEGFECRATHVDIGENHYFDFIKIR